MKLSSVCIALLAILPAAASAQAAADTAEDESQRRSGWSVGLAAIASDSPYAGEGVRATPFPLLSYEGERWFWRGISGGMHLIDHDQFALDAVISGRFDGFDIKDLGRRELAINGLDADLLEDRDHALDAGIVMAWEGAAGELQLQLKADVTDTSGGQELQLSYGQDFQFGALTLTPTAGLRWLSDDLANYYYGTLPTEIARGAQRYEPGSASVPQLGVSFMRPLGSAWALLGELEYQILPDELSDSPLLEADDNLSLFIGVVRGF